MGIEQGQSAPELKIERAKHHIAELNEKLRAFIRTDFYDLSVQIDAETGDNLLNFQITKPIPTEFALITGDVIHNLRAALDLAWAKLIREKHPSAFDKFTKFPVRDSREKLIAALKGREIQQSLPSLYDFILSIKPYKGGNDAICALHELDIHDKHRLLLPMIKVVGLVGVDAEDDRHNRLSGLNMFVDTAARVLTVVKTASNLHIKNYGKPTFQIFFDEGLPMQGQPIIPTLEQFVELVSSVVSRMGELR